ncbi:MAG: hydantoinase/oxoprolinase family protein, partial [Vicinamibacteria bacterium]
IMQSNGGMISARSARREAVRTILSGPAGGVVGAFASAQAAALKRAITFDMGGTSTDVALCDGSIPILSGAEVGGYPIGVPMIGIHSVGAGGGSIAWIDRGGGLRVGPASAGADPGPICYGRGGNRITVTDANLFLRRMDPTRFLGGRLRLRPERVRGPLVAMGRRLGLSPEALAEGVVRVANAVMEKAIRVISIERGFDPRDFVLVSFGGAGGMHALDLARALSIPRVLIPRHPGVLSALGLVHCDVRKELTQSFLSPVTAADFGELRKRFERLLRSGAVAMTGEGISARRVRADCVADLRYVGQSYELAVPFDRHFLDRFHQLHRRRYGHSDRKAPVELVNLRVRWVGRVDRPPILRPDGPASPRRGAAPFARWPMIFEGRARRGRGYLRPDLPPGFSFRGPAVVLEEHATTVVTPDASARVDRMGNLFLEWSR